MGKEKKVLKGDALVNKVVLIIMEIINVSLILGYISDFLNESASIVYFVVFEIAAVFTFIAVPVAYKKFPEKMKYIAFVCFSVVYAIGCLGATIDVAFVMAFPIVVIFILYYDYDLVKKVTTTFNVIIVADVLYIVLIKKSAHSGGPINTSVLLMEFLGTTVFLIAVRVVTKISNQNNSEKIEQIQAVADKVNESIKNVNGEIVELNNTSQSVKGAMDEINQGISNVAEAIENQMLQTEAIQNRIESVQSAAEGISTNIASTLESVESGNMEVDTLVSQADQSVEISENVSKDLAELKDRVDAMSDITKMIENIAFQTNIMALNANIEAARAGDAGLGFAVVATDIANMAAKTKEATGGIEEAEIILSEKKQTTQTSNVFSDIQKTSEEVSNHLAEFMDYINGLTKANSEIVQSVQTISAATEQVNALTMEATNMESQNAYAVQSIAEQVGALAD